MHLVMSFVLGSLVAATAMTGPALGEEPNKLKALASGPALTEALSRGGYVLYMRHTKTNRRQKDVDHLGDLSNCANQRNLSEEGREQAKMIGLAMQRLRINVGKIYSSPYCRAVDTAQLAFGKLQLEDNLRYLTFLSRENAIAATNWLHKQLSIPPKARTNTLLVSHTANLKKGLGLWPGNPGDVFVFRPAGDKGYTYVGRITPKEWLALAGLS